MSCCPGLRCKNTGSGYVKPDGAGGGDLMEKRISEMLATRAQQDATIFPSLKNTTTYVAPTSLNVADSKSNKTQRQ